MPAGGDIDIIRRSVEFVFQALIDTQGTELIGAGRHKRGDSRTVLVTSEAQLVAAA